MGRSTDPCGDGNSTHLHIAYSLCRLHSTLRVVLVARAMSNDTSWYSGFWLLVSRCKNGLQELNSLAQDHRKWKLVTKQAMDTNGRLSHGSWRRFDCHYRTSGVWAIGSSLQVQRMVLDRLLSPPPRVTTLSLSIDQGKLSRYRHTGTSGQWALMEVYLATVAREMRCSCWLTRNERSGHLTTHWPVMAPAVLLSCD